MCADWNQLFKDPDKVIRDPDPLGILFIDEVNANFPVLDLGCGAGRHLIQMAEAGLTVIGADISPVGLNLANHWLNAKNLHAELFLTNMARLPIVDGSLGGVISINVLNHGTIDNFKAAVSDVYRVLKKGSPFFSLIIGREDARYGEGDEIESHTFIHRQGIEAGVPHHFFTPEEIGDLLGGFERLELEERKRLYDDKEPVFGDDPRLKSRTEATLQHWAVKAWK
jgi:SAM-dependent methyltransferase